MALKGFPPQKNVLWPLMNKADHLHLTSPLETTEQLTARNRDTCAFFYILILMSNWKCLSMSQKLNVKY